MSNDKERSSTHFGFGFLAGLIVGMLLLYALGTKKGKRVIEQLLTQGGELWGEMLEKNPELEDKLEVKTAQIAKTVSDVKKAAENAGVKAKKERLRSFGRETAARFFRKNGKPLA